MQGVDRKNRGTGGSVIVEIKDEEDKVIAYMSGSMVDKIGNFSSHIPENQHPLAWIDRLWVHESLKWPFTDILLDLFSKIKAKGPWITYIYFVRTKEGRVTHKEKIYSIDILIAKYSKEKELRKNGKRQSSAGAS